MLYAIPQRNISKSALMGFMSCAVLIFSQPTKKILLWKKDIQNTRSEMRSDVARAPLFHKLFWHAVFISPSLCRLLPNPPNISVWVTNLCRVYRSIHVCVCTCAHIWKISRRCSFVPKCVCFPMPLLGVLEWNEVWNKLFSLSGAELRKSHSAHHTCLPSIPLQYTLLPWPLGLHWSWHLTVTRREYWWLYSW